MTTISTDALRRRARLGAILNAVSDDALYDPTPRWTNDGNDSAPTGFALLAVPSSGGEVISAALLRVLRARDDGIAVQRLGDQPDRDIALPDDAVFNQLFRVGVARHPLARLVAVWQRYLGPNRTDRPATWRNNHPDLQPDAPFEAFCDYVTALEGSDTFAAPEWKSQHLFLSNRSGHSIMNLTLMWDRLDRDFQRLTNLLCLDASALPTAGPAAWTGPDAPEAWRDLYTPRMVRQVSNRYAIDLRVFGFG